MCSVFTLVFFAVGASAQKEDSPGLLHTVNWVGLLEKNPWIVFRLVLVYITYRFGIAAIQICADMAAEYCSNRLFEPSAPPTPDSDGLAIELNNLPPLLSPSSTGYLLDGPVPDSGSPTLFSSPLPPLPGDVRRQ